MFLLSFIYFATATAAIFIRVSATAVNIVAVAAVVVAFVTVVVFCHFC